MPGRKNLLVVGEVYHIFSKSIAGFKIFNNESEFSRMTATLRYYQIEKPPIRFSRFIQSSNIQKDYSDKEKMVQIIAYCLMPTHLHFILKQLKENGISNYMRNLLDSYTRYFNIKHKRKGPLWEGRFKSVLVETDEQLLHLTRYVHLNPVTAYLTDKPDKWLASSFKEFISKVNDNERISKFDDILDIEPNSYQEFVLDLISYQQELAKIKRFIFD